MWQPHRYASPPVFYDLVSKFENNGVIWKSFQMWLTLPYGIWLVVAAWRLHEDGISYTSLNYEEDDQPVNYSLK